jgi:hypothetical protein
VTKSTFVVLISIVNATTDQSGVRRLKKMMCVFALPHSFQSERRGNAQRQAQSGA